jgi:hypothetical protein
MRVFSLFCLAVAVWAGWFLREHGMLYVNWPKLNAPAFAVEGYNEALGKAKKDAIIGRFLMKGAGATASGRERGLSISAGNIRLMHLEEGKKRIE